MTGLLLNVEMENKILNNRKLLFVLINSNIGNQQINKLDFSGINIKIKMIKKIANNIHITALLEFKQLAIQEKVQRELGRTRVWDLLFFQILFLPVLIMFTSVFQI